LSRAIKAEGGDNLLLSEHGTFFVNKLTGFLSRSFDSWTNTIISEQEIPRTLHYLDSAVSTLKELHRCPPNMVRMIEKIKALTEV